MRPNEPSRGRAMIRELDAIVLSCDLPEHALKGRGREGDQALVTLFRFSAKPSVAFGRV